MPEVRLIDANALAESDMAKLIDSYLYNYCNLTVGLAAELMPTIEAEPVRHGRWIYKPAEGTACSMCGEMTICEYKFCPNCGARMDGGDDK